MSAPSPGDLTALGAERQHRVLSNFTFDELVTFAALPEWTPELAGAVEFGLGDVGERLAVAGFAERREEITSEGEIAEVWWMPASRRGDVGRFLRDVRSPRHIADRVVRLLAALGPKAPWPVELVADRMQSTSGDLVSTVDSLLGQGETIRAVEFVAAAQALGDLYGEPLLSASRRAQWRIDRAYREGIDAQVLEHYLPRPELEGPLVDLVRSTSDWALHLVGAGGVGKTMTVRDLASGQFFDRYGLPRAPVARVDFDHLDPRYPHRRPGELLLALTAELVGHTTNRSGYRAYRLVDDAVAALHEVLAEDGKPDRSLDRVVDSFAAFLNEFEQTTVLVLDTCEELAKLHAPGGRAPAVDYTFEMLERIHERAPMMKALLAGRRWLVPTDASRSAGLELSPRPYLTVVTVPGFAREQGETYLDTRDPSRTISDPLRDVVLTRSHRPDASDINPFDLACYTDWALDEPGLDPARLLDDKGDPYIRQRIIERVSNTAVRDSLPAVVELGRFDLPMIEPYLRRRGIDPAEAFSGLVAQEWVSAVTFDADGRPRVIEIDDQLLPRLRAAVASFPLDRHRLGRDLAELIASQPVESLVVEAVEGALRLLPLDEAAVMWSALEERIVHQDAWGWALIATPRAAAVESTRWPLPTGRILVYGTEPTLLAAILATQAAAVLRQPGQPGLRELWKGVTREASRHPDPATAAWLELRGRCGRIATASHPNEDDVRRIEELRTTPDLRSWSASALAAAEGCLVRGETVPDVLREEMRPTRGVRAAAVELVDAAGHLIDGDPDEAYRGVELLLSTRWDDRRQWPDWVPPARMDDRIRLARVAIALARFEPWNPEFAAWRAEAIPHLADIDAERLVAATIELEFGWRPVNRAEIELVVRTETYEPHRQPTSYWHGFTGTLCRVANVALAAAGDVGGAISNLQLRKDRATAFGEDPATIDQCDHGLITLYQRFRADELAKLVNRLFTSDTAAVRAAAEIALECYGDPTYFFLPLPQREFDTSALSTRSALPERFDELVVSLLMAEASGGVVRDDVTAFLDRVPTRRVAELALARGQAVAQMQPESAILLLERAVGLFRRCGDQDAEYRAALLLAHTADRAGLDRRSTVPNRRDVHLYGGWRDLGDWLERQRRDEPVVPYDTASPTVVRPHFDPPTGMPTGPPPITEPSEAVPTGRALDWRWSMVVVALVVGIALWFLLGWIAALIGTAVLAAVTTVLMVRRPEKPSVVATGASAAYRFDGPGWSRCTVARDGRILVRALGKELNVGAGKAATLNKVEFQSSGPFVVVPLQLGVDEILEPWEQELGARHPRLGGKTPLWVRLRRVGRLVSTEFLWPNEQEDAAHRRAVVDRYRGPANLRPEVVTRPENRVYLHLVGTPVPAKDGWRFRIGETGAGQKTGRTTYGYEQLLSAADVPQQGVHLVVLQAEPVDGPAEPLGTLREGMSRFADEMLADHVVLIVPPLPDRLAAEVAALVENMARWRPPTSDMVLDLAYEIRKRITDPAVSLDVLLIL